MAHKIRYLLCEVVVVPRLRLRVIRDFHEATNHLLCIAMCPLGVKLEASEYSRVLFDLENH